MLFTKLQRLASPGLLLAAALCAAGATPPTAAPVLAAFELSDQYGIVHRISFPATNVTLMTVADRQGSEQIDGWIAPLEARYGGRIVIAGIADLSQVPGLLRSMVREKFRKRWVHPVMLDWEGSVARGFHYQKDKANVFVIDREGRMTGHFTGATNEVALTALFAEVDLLLGRPRP